MWFRVELHPVARQVGHQDPDRSRSRRCPGLGGHLRETDPHPPGPGVEAVGWGPGRNLVASTTGRAIRFWDTETWECSAKIPLTGSRTAPM